MIDLKHREDCCGCGACAAACPHGAILMLKDGMGFRYPAVNSELCTGCGICNSVCAFRPVESAGPPEASAIRFPDYLDKSQSGGLGYALMRKAIQEGMIVYGAAIEEDFSVRHIRVTTLEGLEPLRLSKYVQSDMDGIPTMVLEDLKAGNKVLFTGTPCQCAGVGSLCGQYGENLILVDLICHGVPAPAVWKGYLESRGRKVTKAVFRDTSLGWHDHREALWYGRDKEVSDTFTFLFYRNIMLRPSCGECPFASTARCSDITMGDCWGIEKAAKGLIDDDRGWSLLICSSHKGKEFVSGIEGACGKKAINLSDVRQPNLYAPTRRHPHSKCFERTFLKGGFLKADRNFGRSSLEYRLERFIKKVKRHL